MSLGSFMLRRVLVALLLVFVVSSGAFLLTIAAPGDFTTDRIDIPAEQRDRLRQQYGLDRPVVVQYFDWLSRVMRLDFGQSLHYSRPVGDLLGERAANTALLATSALALATTLGIPLGIYTGSRSRGLLRALIRVLSLAVLSVPPLIASLLLMLIAARTGWFPVGGLGSAGAANASWSVWLGDLAHYVPLPALALALPLTATLERLQSQSMNEAVTESFVRAARARGLAPATVVWRHAWPVSLTPVLALYGLMIGSLFSGSFVVEVVTSWPGLGRLMFDAIHARDLYLVAGCAAVGAAFLAIGTLIADVLLAVVDPRRRLGAEA